jgi:hypothetical protein
MKSAVEAADRGAGGADDDDIIRHGDFLSWRSFDDKKQQSFVRDKLV